jgi:hypothetical protein
MNKAILLITIFPKPQTRLNQHAQVDGANRMDIAIW